MICVKKGLKWIGACYFAYGHKSFSSVKKKFLNDLKGVEKHKVNGIAFVTNQKLTVGQRETLVNLANCRVDILHLETLTLLLNSPINYGIREDFLDIQMTEEENLSFTAARDKEYLEAMGYVPKAYNDPNTVVTKDTRSMHIHIGQIYMANLGNGLRGETMGIRPVLIVSNNIHNKFAPTVTVVPLTKQIIRAQLPTHVKIGVPSVERPSVALVEQVTNISKLRLMKYISKIDNRSLKIIKSAIAIQMDLVQLPRSKR